MIALGLLLAAIGSLWRLFPKTLGWFGQLPSDIRLERDHTRVFIPLTSMLLVSLMLTLLRNLVVWLLRGVR